MTKLTGRSCLAKARNMFPGENIQIGYRQSYGFKFGSMREYVLLIVKDDNITLYVKSNQSWEQLLERAKAEREKEAA